MNASSPQPQSQGEFSPATGQTSPTESPQVAPGADLDALFQSADLDALLEIARRYAGQPLTVNPIVVEMVEAMLRQQYAANWPNQVWKTLAQPVAESLYHDPAAQQRLQAFWRRLSMKV